MTSKTVLAPQPSPKVYRLAVAGLGGLIVQIILGGLVRHTHSGLACPNFPHCLAGFFPIPFTFGSGLAFFHRWWGILMLGLFLHLAIVTAKKMPSLAKPSRQVFSLAVAQVVLGIGTVLSHLETGSRAIHAAVGYALWGLLFSIALRAGAFRWLWNQPKRSIH